MSTEVRTYRAGSVQEALEQVERDLGREAVILQTRQVAHRRWLPWRPAREEVEVVAGTGWSVAHSVETPTLSTASPLIPATSTDSSDSSDSPRIAPATPAPSFSTLPDNLTAAFSDRLASLEERLSQFDTGQAAAGPMIPRELFDLYTELIDAELDEQLARDLVFQLKREAPAEEVADRTLSRARLAQMIEAEFTAGAQIVPTPGQRRVVALVGPTGVGKTTTIAKLAANFRLREGVRMGLVTVDTYRIAAVEQLRTYAEIIDLPMQVVTTPMEMRRALDEFSGMDLVLIDTAGRSPRDELQINELKSLLIDADVDEVQLVLSMTAGLPGLVSTVERFSSVGTSSLILTKLDEAHELGSLLNLAREVRLPISYLTTGQDVPDDIEPAETHRLARLVLGQDQLFDTATAGNGSGG